MTEYLGVSLDDLASTTPRQAIHPDDLPAVRAAYAGGIRSGEPFAVECRIRRYDGEFRWHIARGMPTRDSAGKIAGWVGSASDIDELRFERARYRSLADTVSEIIWSSNPAGEITFANVRFWDYFGVTPAEWTGALQLSLIHEDERSAISALYAAGLRGREPFEFEYRIRRADGEYRWHIARCMPVFDNDGTVNGWIGSAADIEGQKQAEERVAELNRELARRLADTESLLGLLPIGVGITNDSEPQSVRFNAALAGMLGVDADRAMDIYRPGARTPYRILRNGEPVPREGRVLYRCMSTGQPVYDEADVERSDGTTRHLLIYATPLMDGGRVRGAIGAYVDVTEMRRAQDLLLQAQARYAAAGDAVPFGVWASNTDGDTVYASDSFLQLLGKTTEEVRYSGWLDSLPPDQRAPYRREWEEAFNAHVPWEKELELLGADGEYHWVLTRGQPAYDADGAFRGYAGINLDITNLKRIQAELARTVEELRQASSVKDELLGLVSHELRTPLTAIIGNAQSLRRHQELIPVDQRDSALQDIEDEGARLHRLIENMLLLARVEGTGDYEPEPVLLQRMLPRIAEQLKLRVPGLDVELHLDPALPTASAQPGYIEQVVQNLVGNAVKYSGGALRVEITAVRDGPWVRVAVEDRGTGITSEEASQVFTPFFRSERTSSSAGGIGLGLAVCKRLVEVQHGRIWAEPRPGGGTTVAFTLPLEVDRDD
jgi:PAS domain S-box-containing protein